jgi:hypothetical protein
VGGEGCYTNIIDYRIRFSVNCLKNLLTARESS